MVFSWALKAGMYDAPQFSTEDVPNLNATTPEKMQVWKSWIRSEVARRTVLGLYIVDGLVAQFAGGVPCGRHATNPLSFSSHEAVFKANTADDWIVQMNK